MFKKEVTFKNGLQHKREFVFIDRRNRAHLYLIKQYPKSMIFVVFGKPFALMRQHKRRLWADYGGRLQGVCELSLFPARVVAQGTLGVVYEGVCAYSDAWGFALRAHFFLHGHVC